ncbi:MAG: type II toxin-antitoxin system Phd/YefM family antitoxin [Spirochaetales bacterium]|nr:type II toxin-antitoxin system Phd/YefM family antitoxin [Spirochaetales bacterium]
MKTLLFTEFRKNASKFISQVEHGETLILLRRGKPVAEVIPFSDDLRKIPSWKKQRIRLQINGSDLSSAILEERNEG